MPSPAAVDLHQHPETDLGQELADDIKVRGALPLAGIVPSLGFVVIFPDIFARVDEALLGRPSARVLHDEGAGKSCGVVCEV